MKPAWVVVVTTAPWVKWRERTLAEKGRRLASQRDDLIAQGVDPADLLIPLHPDDGHS